jgi:hypothetical protein
MNGIEVSSRATEIGPGSPQADLIPSHQLATTSKVGAELTPSIRPRKNTGHRSAITTPIPIESHPSFQAFNPILPTDGSLHPEKIPPYLPGFTQNLLPLQEMCLRPVDARSLMNVLVASADVTPCLITNGQSLMTIL